MGIQFSYECSNSHLELGHGVAGGHGFLPEPGHPDLHLALGLLQSGQLLVKDHGQVLIEANVWIEAMVHSAILFLSPSIMST